MREMLNLEQILGPYLLGQPQVHLQRQPTNYRAEKNLKDF